MLGTLPPAARESLNLVLSCLTESGPSLTEVGPERCCGTSFGETSRILAAGVSLNLVRARRMFR
jgi:hypothetical protein